ncbi:hypothetical protein HMPREF1146_0478 [Prevotella sp. MSX73]|nr:hypothetical protein HMPREF1146_0478 [Prevotella sp. MSX73]
MSLSDISSRFLIAFQLFHILLSRLGLTLSNLLQAVIAAYPET